MGRIRILPDIVANKIAAGEVVERPASVVKELLENSLDARSTRLRIELESAGKRLIRISDDGVGMGHDDSMLAFERHATSKLREARDLFSISTLGFRGEALPSIAGISRLILETRSADEPTGTKVEIAGGRMLNVDEAALPAGTTISVRDLFYNVPARRKFMRTEKTELSHISSVVMHYSLAHLDKSFTLSNEKGRLLKASPVETLEERVFQIFGADTLDRLVELPRRRRSLEVAGSPVPATRAVEAARTGASAAQQRDFSVHGFVSTPQVQKLNRNSVYIFVNHRLIRDRLLLRAISRAYHNLIPPGNFPFVLLFIEMPFDEVDVNVHPSKTEVRFRHPGFVHDFLRDTIRERLIESKPVSTFPLPPSDHRPAGQPGAALPFSETSRVINEAQLPAAGEFSLGEEPPPPARLDFSSAPPIDFPMRDAGSAAPPIGLNVPPADAPPGATDSAGAAVFARAEAPVIEEKLHSRAPLVDMPSGSMADLGHLRSLGQIHESFIVAAAPSGLWIIDQHVAHERILFEKVLAERTRGAIESQRLLLPIIVSLKPDQEIKFARIEKEFDAVGFDVEPFGNRTIAVKAAPAVLSPHQVEQLMEEILDTPESELRALSFEDLERRLAATIACHAAIKINTPLDPAKIQWLLDELAKTDCPMSCPHGRPVALEYGMRDILRAFHRI